MGAIPATLHSSPATGLDHRPAGHSTGSGQARLPDTATASISWLVAEEVPVALEYNGRALTVMMATPADLEDFAIGFSLCEDIVASADAIDQVTIREAPAGPVTGLVVSISTDPLRLLRGSLRRRSMEGRSGCGLCGVESLENAIRDPRPVPPLQFRPNAVAVATAFANLPAYQPMNRLNHSVHAAAWCGPDGTILLAREDVGRHNALDKLVGALGRDGVNLQDGFAVLSSRCSFELVQKAATVGIGMLATLSAPTELALRLARASGITLAARSRGQGVVLFGKEQDFPAQPRTCGEDRI